MIRLRDRMSAICGWGLDYGRRQSRQMVEDPLNHGNVEDGQGGYSVVDCSASHY